MPKPEKTKPLPTAPIASEIYEGGSYNPAPDQTWPTIGWGYDPQYKYRFSEVITAPIKNKSILFKTNPRTIVKEIQYYRNPEGKLVTDTAYVERPEFTNYYPIKVQPRYGSTNDKNRDEYNILQRRFNEAKSVVSHQQGGVMNQQIQQQVIQLVQAAAQGDQNANKQIEQIMQAAQQGDQQAIQIAQMIQQVVEQMKQQSGIKAQLGAKLNYIRKIKGLCPEDQELVYMKEGGRMCARCMQKAQNGTKTTKKPDTVQGSKKKKTPMPTKYDGKKHERLALLNADPKKKLTQAQTDSLNTYAKLYRELPDSIKARDYNDQDVLSKACGGKAKKH